MTVRILPLFERDTQVCTCGHTGGQHGHRTFGQWVGIGLGECYRNKLEWTDDGYIPACGCTVFNPK